MCGCCSCAAVRASRRKRSTRCRLLRRLRLGHLDRHLAVELLVVGAVDPAEGPLAEELPHRESGDALGQVRVGERDVGGGAAPRGVVRDRAVLVAPTGDVVGRLAGGNLRGRSSGDRRPGRCGRDARSGRVFVATAGIEVRLLFGPRGARSNWRRNGGGLRRVRPGTRIAGSWPDAAWPGATFTTPPQPGRVQGADRIHGRRFRDGTGRGSARRGKSNLTILGKIT